MGRTERREASAQEFGRRVRDARQAQGLSQEVVAQRSGLSTPYVSSVERGERNVSLFNILRLARSLEVEAGDLIRDLPAPPDRGRY